MTQAKAVERRGLQEHHSAANVMDRDFHGAAIIDENGKEVPITEDMIQKACQELSNAWLFPRQIHRH